MRDVWELLNCQVKPRQEDEKRKSQSGSYAETDLGLIGEFVKMKHTNSRKMGDCSSESKCTG